MNVKSKRRLVKQQNKLVLERKKWEQMQTDCSYDKDFCKFCEWKINILNEEAEKIRYVLEGRCFE